MGTAHRSRIKAESGASNGRNLTITYGRRDRATNEGRAEIEVLESRDLMRNIPKNIPARIHIIVERSGMIAG